MLSWDYFPIIAHKAGMVVDFDATGRVRLIIENLYSLIYSICGVLCSLDNCLTQFM